MANPKKKTIPTEENVDLLNEEDQVSESPSTLVAPSPDQEYEPNSQDGSKLSPNPAHFGFTSQRLVDSLPLSGELNVLYIVPIKTGGNEVIGYKKWTWDLETRSWRRVYGSIANLSLKDGGREQRAIVSNPNRSKPRVFNEDVNINGVLRVNGKEVETRDPTGDEDSVRLYKTSAAFGSNITDIDFSQVKPGDIIFSIANDMSGIVSGITQGADLTINVVQNNKFYRYRTDTGTFVASGDTVVEGTRLFKHTFSIENYQFSVVSTKATAYTDLQSVYQDIYNVLNSYIRIPEPRLCPCFFVINGFVDIYDIDEHVYYHEMIDWEVGFTDDVTEL